MAVNLAEYREWFLTLEGINLTPIIVGDLPAEQDSPRTIKEVIVDGINYPIIFKQDGTKIPKFDDDTYIKLFKSVPFKLNQSDRAKDSDHPNYFQNEGDPNEGVLQGLVTVATDVEAKAFSNGDEALYTRVPRVSQLPSVGEDTGTLQLSSVDFDITLIPQSPSNWINVRIDPAEDERNNYLLRVENDVLNWLRDSFDAVKQYVDSNEVIDGGITITSAAPSDIAITTVPATSTDTTKWEVAVTIGLDDDGTLAQNSTTRIPSQRAVKSYVDNTVVGINLKASQADLLALALRVDTMQGGTGASLKANQSDFLLLQAEVANKLSRTVNDTALGVITFNQVPLTIADPVSNNGLARKLYVDNRDLLLLPLDGSRPMTGELTLAGNPLTVLGATPKQYVDERILRTGDTMSGHLGQPLAPTSGTHLTNKTYVDGLIAGLQLQIDTLDARVDALENRFIGVLAGGTYSLERLSSITVNNSGLVTNITT
jgi:hypothetical protein